MPSARTQQCQQGTDTLVPLPDACQRRYMKTDKLKSVDECCSVRIRPFIPEDRHRPIYRWWPWIQVHATRSPPAAVQNRKTKPQHVAVQPTMGKFKVPRHAGSLLQVFSSQRERAQALFNLVAIRCVSSRQSRMIRL